MLRGLLLGVSWGGLIAATAATSVSLVYSNANRAAVVGDAQEVTAVHKPDVDGETVQATLPVGEAETSAQEATQSQTDAPVTDLPSADTADTPVDETSTAALAAEVTEATAPDVMIPAEDTNADDATTNEVDMPIIAAQDAPVLPGETAGLPTAPKPEAAPQADSQTAAMTAPEMQDAPKTGDAGQGDMPPEIAAPEVQGTALPQITTPDQPQTSEQDATLAVPSPSAPPADAPADATAEPATESASEPATPATEGQFDTARVPVPKIRNLAPNVETNRLPTIGGASESDVVEVGGEVPPAPDKRALVAHAMTFENPGAKPMFSVILIDDPQHPISDDVLSHLPFALSFAVDAVRDDAYATATRYRAAGFEVLMLTNLPFGANATDVEVAFGAYGRAIPEAVGVLDLGANGFLRGPSTATQIAGIMSEKGYGLITPSKGLNSAQKAAMREGVPAALVFRELDVDGEKPSVIRRYLDRAAFRAAQEGSVIMLGHTRPDTIEALVTWALEDRAATVVIAPVSAVLLDQ